MGEKIESVCGPTCIIRREGQVCNGCIVRVEGCDGCTTRCTTGCTTGCQVRCQTGCQVRCQTGCQVTCQTGCEVTCQTGCEVRCQTGCEVTCQTGCTTGCTARCESTCIIKIENCGRCDSGCTTRIVMFGCTTSNMTCRVIREQMAEAIEPQQLVVAQPQEMLFVDKWLDAIIVPEDNTLPVTGEIEEGTVMVETGKAIFRPGTELTVVTSEGNRVKGKSMISTGIGILAPIEASIEVTEDGTAKILGGTLILAEGDFRKDEGITIRKDSKATILFGGKARTGEIAEDTIIGLNKLYMERSSSAIKRLTR